MIGFTPSRYRSNLLLSVPKLFAYYDATDVTLSGSSITRVINQANNFNTSRDLTPVSSQPTLIYNDSNFNLQPSISSTGTNTRLEAVFDAPINQPETVYLVMRVESNANTVFWRTNQGNLTDSIGFYLQSDLLPRIQVLDGGNTITSGNALSAPNTYVSCTTYNGGSSAIYFNDPITPNASGTIDTNGCAILTIGSFGSAVSLSWACMAIFNESHSQETRSNIMKYLGAKYGVKI